MNGSESNKPSRTAGVFAAALVVIALVNFVGNTMVLFVVYRQWKNMKQRVTNTLLANLAFIDLLVATVLIPLSMTVLIEGRNVLTFTVCQIDGFMNNIYGSASILTMAVIGIDRYNAIVSRRGHRLKLKHARALVVCVWIISVVMSLLPIILWGKYHVTEKSTQCKPESGSYLLLLAIVCFVIPLAIMVFSYTKVFLKVRRHRKLLSSWRKNKCNMKREFKTTKIVFTVLTIFTVAWAPYVIVHILSTNIKVRSIPSGVFKFCGLLPAAHSMCNPIIYFTMNRAFRRDAIIITPFLHRCFGSDAPADEDKKVSSGVSCEGRSSSLALQPLSGDTLKKKTPSSS